MFAHPRPRAKAELADSFDRRTGGVALIKPGFQGKLPP